MELGKSLDKNRWNQVAAFYGGNLPQTAEELHASVPSSLLLLQTVCRECEHLADGGETLCGVSLPKSIRGDGFRQMLALIDELQSDRGAGARLAEQFVAVLLVWLFPDFAKMTGCAADAFCAIERDLFGEQRKGKSGARTSVIRPALHPMELWAKYASRPLVE